VSQYAATTEQLEHIHQILQQLDAQSPGPDANRRRAKRITIRMALEVHLLSNHNRPTSQIYTRNVSTSGIGFVTRRVFKPKEFLAFSFRIANHAPKLVLARVTFCRYVKGALHESGAEFIESTVENPHLEDKIPPNWVQLAQPKILIPTATH
jgi:hypothetical protein